MWRGEDNIVMLVIGALVLIWFVVAAIMELCNCGCPGCFIKTFAVLVIIAVVWGFYKGFRDNTLMKKAWKLDSKP